MGGWSAEREISLRSGKACAAALGRAGYRVTAIDVGRDVAAVLAAAKPDVALNVLHGRPGEDGTIQGLLEIMAIPYSHSACSPRRWRWKRIRQGRDDRCRRAGAGRGRRLALRRGESACARAPHVIKPIAEGSSVGVFIVTQEHAHPPQELTRGDWLFGEDVLCERYIAGKELTCAVMGDRALDVIEIVPTTNSTTTRPNTRPAARNICCRRRFRRDVYAECQRSRCGASRARLPRHHPRRLPLRRRARLHGLFCLEVNTQPGMTETSLVPELAAHAGIAFEELVRWMVEDASLDR